MQKQKLTGWKKQLIDIVSEQTGCEAQYNGCPCNTCFHTFFCKALGNEIGHRFWEVVLVARGDYTEADILDYELIKIPKYYTETKTGKKKYDIEGMRAEFEAELLKLK